MDGENKAHVLLEVIEESNCLSPDLFDAVLHDEPSYPWYNMTEDRFPRLDILKDMYRELAMEALRRKGAVSAEQLKQFREGLLTVRLSYLDCGDIGCASIASSPEGATSLRDKVRLCRECVEFYVSRKSEYEPGYNTLLNDLRYIEILAGKIVHDFPGLGLSEGRDKEFLKTLVVLYGEGYDNLKGEFGFSSEEHAEKACRAREEIEVLYGHGE